MRALLLLIIFGGLNTQNPDVEIKAFESFEECCVEAYSHIEVGRYAQCASSLPTFKNYPRPPPLRIYMQLWIEPMQGQYGETFEFHRPTMTTCLPEVEVLRSQGHKANCRRGSIGPIAPRTGAHPRRP